MWLRFGSFELSPQSYRLTCRGEAVATEPKILEVLAYLLAHHDRVVSKEELLENVWQGRFVGDAALSRAIAELRKALATGSEGDAARSWIKTIYGRGFAYQGPSVRQDPIASSTAQGPGQETDGGHVAAASRSGRSVALPSPLTPLIGRDDDVRQVCQQLRTCRLLTLTGTGGTGKTRLALESARIVGSEFRHGAVFVPLSEVTSEEGLLVALTLALDIEDPGSSPLAAIQRYLAPRQLLLVLDNFEQLIDAAGLIVSLLHSSPEVVALATSRFVLRVEGEQEWPVAPLVLPRPDSTPEGLVDVPSVALFLSRARSMKPSFNPTNEDLKDLAEICRRLDGLPLAIELAAAWIKILSPQSLRQQLAERFDLLSPPSQGLSRRHRTLDEALEWSHDLLDSHERVLLRRLAVFAGDFPLSAVEPVCADIEPKLQESLGLVSSLIDRSLVEPRGQKGDEVDHTESSREGRFRLLETTRAFALRQLQASGEEDAARRAHCRWACAIAGGSRSQLLGNDQLTWLRQLDIEHANWLSAITWCSSLAGDLEEGLSVAPALSRYWAVRGYLEGRSVLESLLAAESIGTIEPEQLARPLMALGMICHLMGDYAAAENHLSRAIEIFRRVDDRSSLAEALCHLGWVYVQNARLTRAETYSLEALALHREAGQPRGVAVAFNNLGWVQMCRGDFEAAEEQFSKSEDYRRRSGDSRGLAYGLINRATNRMYHQLSIDLGLAGTPDIEPVTPVPNWIEDADRLLQAVPDRPLHTWLATARGMLLLHQGKPETAVQLLLGVLEGQAESENPEGVVQANSVLGEALKRIGRLQEARDRLTRARDAAAELGTIWSQSEALRQLGNLEREAGDSELASGYYRAALELARERGFSFTEAACRRALSA